MPNPLTDAGRVVDQVPVKLSYQIIKHFSEELYSSPYKALEELVANSYDALATHVHVVLPDDLAADGAVIWVVDDGDAMDLAGFEELWRIGISSRRDAGKESQERPPIGKFGIGKLATYVLAKELTHICRHGGQYRAVTMRFSDLEVEPDRTGFTLDVRRLSQQEAKRATKPVLSPAGKGAKPGPIRLFGKGASRTWTVAALSNLTRKAQGVTGGRLKRVLSAALPINPQFNLYYNGAAIKPSRVKRPTIAHWSIGDKDQAAEGLKFASKKTRDGEAAVMVPDLGLVYGRVQLFEAALPGSKADVWGRSHGFFVLVRGRLINLHDELFGLEALSHGAFSRFRMVVHADGLDDFLRATRESVAEDEPGVVNFRAYLKAKFNEARAAYLNWMNKEAALKSLSGRVSRTPRSLSRQPLVQAIRGVLAGSIDDLVLTRVPPGLSDGEKKSLITSLEDALDTEDFFSDVRFDALGLERGLAEFDVKERCLLINTLHPFFANYSEHYKSAEPFQLLAITEVLTEAYLLDEGLSSQQVRRILDRRDRFLRELVYSTQLSAPLVAQLLDDNKADPKGLERAVYEGFRSLGFEVSRLGGRGKPDGIALARLGVRDEDTGEDKSYGLTYDAKSTAGKRVSAKAVGAATIAQHRDDLRADFAVVVAPGYQGDGEPKSNVVKQAKTQGITLLTVADFIRLVLAAATRPLPFRRMRDELFTKCRGPKDAARWINKLLKEPPPKTPLPQILHIIWQMMKDLPEPPKFAAVADRLRSKGRKYRRFRVRDVQDWIASVRRFERDLISVDGSNVYLETRPEIILERVIAHARSLPQAILKGSMYGTLSRAKPKRKKKAQAISTKRIKKRKSRR